jgi:hypothetical protein
MGIEKSQILALIKTLHLFRKIADDKLVQMVEQMEVIEVEEGHEIYREGMVGDSFYIIYQGKVEVYQGKKERLRILAHLVKADYFGEEALLYKKRRTTSVRAVVPTILLRLSVKDFYRVIHHAPLLKSNFQVMISSRRLARNVQFKWLQNEEEIYFVSRKHEYFLWVSMLGPAAVALFLLIIALISIQYLSGLVFPLVVIGLLFAADIIWGLWAFIDWHNDYYIVTNQRVVYLERVFGIYDSRQEAPLGTLLSVGIQTDQIGRIIGYGDVIVRTFTGPIVLHRVSLPEQVASMIEEYWFRTKSATKQAETATMERAILTRIKGTTGGEVQKAAPAPQPQPSKSQGLLRAWLENLFRIRVVEGEVVTYRKHWFILILKTWKPVGSLILLIVFTILRLQNHITFLPLLSFIVLALLGMIIIVLWLLYNFVDWRNDIYQVTAEQIWDIERKPLGKEEKRSAPLENILSIEYERLGLIGLLFNFGTVNITVGATKLNFDFVHNPSQVQEDIFRRMTARLNKKKETEAVSERQRMVEWIAAYHRTIEQEGYPQKNKQGTQNSG